jgi:hypothetical protein
VLSLSRTDAKKFLIITAFQRDQLKLIFLLLPLPMSKQLWEHHMMTGLVPGGNGSNGLSWLDVLNTSLTASVRSSEIFCSEHLQWLSGKDGSHGIALNHWLKGQSMVPSHMWHRPFGN